MTIESTLLDDGTRVLKFDSIGIFHGNPEYNVTPLEEFIVFVTEVYRVHGGHVHIDMSKVHICPHDAELLYSRLRTYLFNSEGHTGTSKAASIWQHFRPHETTEVPRGHVFIELGCLYIEDDLHLTPSIPH